MKLIWENTKRKIVGSCGFEIGEKLIEQIRKWPYENYFFIGEKPPTNPKEWLTKKQLINLLIK